MIVSCPRCAARFRLSADKVRPALRLRCTRCREIFSPDFAALPSGSSPGPRVIVAHESVAFCEAVAAVLVRERFQVTICNDGIAVMDAVAADPPAALVIDVALPKLYGFQICERLKNDPATSAIGIVLIAAIYDKTRYKRMPVSLYGADDYIEKHHIPDDLASKLNRLLADQRQVEDGEREGEQKVAASPLVESEQELARQEQTRLGLQQDELKEVEAAGRESLPEEYRKARRLARIIVSDIALYNQEKVLEGVRNGTFFELLAPEVQEGELLYRERAPEGIDDAPDYLREAFVELMERIRRELELS